MDHNWLGWMMVNQKALLDGFHTLPVGRCYTCLNHAL
nr:hypothetical protein Q903MT_gene2033 [Picea sitchensis]